MGPTLFCLALRPGLNRFRDEFEREGVEAFAYMDDFSLDLPGIMANAIRAFAFLRRELEDIGIVVNTSKTVALPPKGHAPTAEEIDFAPPKRRCSRCLRRKGDGGRCSDRQ